MPSAEAAACRHYNETENIRRFLKRGAIKKDKVVSHIPCLAETP